MDTISEQDLPQIITAEQANKLYNEALATKRISEFTKMATIMKNIKRRSAKGFYYYDYQASITYAMAKTLLENGYILKSKKQGKLELKDFAEKGYYGTRVLWKDEE